MAGTSCRNNHIPHPSQSSAPFAQSAKQRPEHVPLSTTSSAHADLKAVNAGNPQGVTGFLPRTFRQDAKRLRSAKRDAEPLCMSEDVPERSPVTPPDSRWEF